MPQKFEPQDGSGGQLRDDQVRAERSGANTITRIQARTAGYVARHPALLKVLQWLGWNNPGGSMNP